MKSKRNITEIETRDSRTLASEFVKLYNKKDISSIKSMLNQMTNNQFGDFIDMLDLKHGGMYSNIAEKLYNDSISSANITNERKYKMRKEKLIESAVRKIVEKVIREFDETYEGWSNFDTWAVFTYINNEQPLYELVKKYRGKLTVNGMKKNIRYAASV